MKHSHLLLNPQDASVAITLKDSPLLLLARRSVGGAPSTAKNAGTYSTSSSNPDRQSDPRITPGADAARLGRTQTTLRASFASAVCWIAVLCVLPHVAGCSPSHTESASASIEAVAPVAPSAAAASTPELHGPPKLIPRPVPAINRVLIISIDGLRPDLLLRGEMPRVRGLCKTGSFSFWAETTPEAYTLPCHVSMLTGTPSEKHGVTWNEYIEQSYPNVPTLFEVAKQAGYSTAMVTGKMKFIVFLKPDTVDHFYLPPDKPVTDRDVAERAESILHQHRPQVMFVHLPGVDTVGHEFGWGSPEQMTAIAQADEAVGLVLDALTDLTLADSTLTILTADHGGAEKGHDTNDPRSHFIPWIASGPGLRQDYDLTLSNRRHIRHGLRVSGHPTGGRRCRRNGA